MRRGWGIWKIPWKTQVIFLSIWKPKFLREEIRRLNLQLKQNNHLRAAAQFKRLQTKGRNDYFKILVLAAHVARELTQKPTFGHFGKSISLCDKVCHMNLSSSYGRYAWLYLILIPNNVFALTQKGKVWVTKTTHGTRYSPDENVKDHEVWCERYFRGQLDPRSNWALS